MTRDPVEVDRLDLFRALMACPGVAQVPRAEDLTGRALLRVIDELAFELRRLAADRAERDQRLHDLEQDVAATRRLLAPPAEDLTSVLLSAAPLDTEALAAAIARHLGGPSPKDTPDASR